MAWVDVLGSVVSFWIALNVLLLLAFARSADL